MSNTGIIHWMTIFSDQDALSALGWCMCVRVLPAYMSSGPWFYVGDCCIVKSFGIVPSVLYSLAQERSWHAWLVQVPVSKS